jgi:hypothetical protein
VARLTCSIEIIPIANVKISTTASLAAAAVKVIHPVGETFFKND